MDNLHWFDYIWSCTNVPKGYVRLADTDFSITYDHLSETNHVVLYLKRVTLTLDSQVSDIIEGETPPAFLYHIEGTDAAGVDHSYDLMVQTEADTKSGSNTLSGMLAGNYEITQVPVSRYVPQTAQNVSHGTVSGINASVNLLDYDSGEILFPYTIQQYGGFGHTDSVVNGLAE